MFNAAIDAEAAADPIVRIDWSPVPRGSLKRYARNIVSFSTLAPNGPAVVEIDPVVDFILRLLVKKSLSFPTNRK
jgi:hypothetical protein